MRMRISRMGWCGKRWICEVDEAKEGEGLTDL